jgi:hypothetical protein
LDFEYDPYRAMSGELVAIEKESPAQQAKEKKAKD